MRPGCAAGCSGESACPAAAGRDDRRDRWDDGAVLQLGRRRDTQPDVHVLSGDDAGIGAGHFGLWGARRNRTAEVNEDRRDYLRYIEALHQRHRKTADAQHQSLHWSHPEPGSLWTLVGSRRMWERGVDDSDFCHVRVGLGTQRLSTRLVAPELGPVDELDPVTSMALRRLIRNRSVVAMVPIAVALPQFPVISIGGDDGPARALVRAVPCQLAVLHSPEHLRIVAVVGPAAEADWEWLKWLPHHQHPHMSTLWDRREWCTAASARPSDCIPPDGGPSPHVAVILDGGQSRRRTAVRPADGAATVLAVGSACDIVPNGFHLHVGADGLSARTDSGDELFAHPDALTGTQALVCARRLAPFRPGVAPIGRAIDGRLDQLARLDGHS